MYAIWTSSYANLRFYRFVTFIRVRILTICGFLIEQKIVKILPKNVPYDPILHAADAGKHLWDAEDKNLNKG